MAANKPKAPAGDAVAPKGNACSDTTERDLCLLLGDDDELRVVVVVVVVVVGQGRSIDVGGEPWGDARMAAGKKAEACVVNNRRRAVVVVIVCMEEKPRIFIVLATMKSRRSTGLWKQRKNSVSSGE